LETSFKPNLTFSYSAGARHSGKLPASPSNIRTGRKNFPKKNTLAYFVATLMAKLEKSILTAALDWRRKSVKKLNKSGTEKSFKKTFNFYRRFF
jgi:hypothetical protein